MSEFPTAVQIRDMGVSDALDVLAGPFGLRRFVVHFERLGTTIRVNGLDSVPLTIGGGPPPPDLTGERMAELTRSLDALHDANGSWRRGAIGYVRDARGKTRLFPIFGDEARHAHVDTLPMPGPPAHPLESPEYLDLRDSLVAPCREIYRQSQSQNTDWENWDIDEDNVLQLFLEVDTEGNPTRVRRHRCQVLGTFEPTWKRFTWRVDRPLFAEKPFGLGDFGCTWDAAMELGLLCAARLGAAWLFVQPVDDRDTVLLVAVLS